MKIPLGLKVTAMKASTWIPAPLNAAWAVPSVASQMVTYRDHYPVKIYKNVTDLSDALRTLTWTEDPWNGQLDVIKHPTWMQEALERHSNYAGDCDDYAAYAAIALLKSSLADEVYFASAHWVDRKLDDVVGHAVCVYRDSTGWHWIGNWNGCRPYDCVRDGWVGDLEKIIKTSVVVAQQWEVTRESHDSILFGRKRVLRR